MPRKRLSLARALTLLVLGVLVGGGLYYFRRLQPGSIKAEVELELDKILKHYELGGVALDMRSGVELQDLVVFYDKDRTDPALEFEKVFLFVDHQQLLRGRIEINHVEIEGLIVRLRPEGADQGTPALPGVFGDSDATSDLVFSDLPEITVRGGEVEIYGLPRLSRKTPLRFDLLEAQGRPDGPEQYTINAPHIHGPRLGSASLEIVFRPGDVTATVYDVELEWDEQTRDLFEDDVRSHLSAMEFEGRAEGSASMVIDLNTQEITHLSGNMQLRDIRGKFGNIHTGEPVGFPFRLEGGRGDLSVDLEKMKIEGVSGKFISPDGTEGILKASFRKSWSTPSADEDLSLEGVGIRASVDDLRLLLPPPVVQTIVDKYLPSGTCDFKLTSTTRYGENKVVANLLLTDGSFDYAGKLDSLTGRRFGFRYKMLGRARIEAETNVDSDKGKKDVIRITGVDGYHPIKDPQGGPDRVTVKAEGTIVAYTDHPGAPEDVSIQIDVYDLPIDEDLARAFSSTRDGVPYDAFEVSGTAPHVRLRIYADAFEQPAPEVDYDIQLKDCVLAYRRFPVHLDEASGRIVARAEIVDGVSVGRTIDIEDMVGRIRDGGTVRGEGRIHQSLTTTDHISIEVKTVEPMTLGPDLRAAFSKIRMLGRPASDLWDRMKPHGTAQAVVRVKTGLVVETDITLDGHTGIEMVDGRPIPIERLVGEIKYDEAGIRILETQGYLGEGKIFLEGHILNGGAVDIRARMHRLHIDENIRRIIRDANPLFESVIEDQGIEPRSVLDGVFRLRRAPGEDVLVPSFHAENFDLYAKRRGLDVHVHGRKLSYEGNLVTLDDLTLRAAGGTVQMDRGHLYLSPHVRGELHFDARNLVAREHLEEFLGEGMTKVLGPNLRADLDDFTVELNYDPAGPWVKLTGDGNLRHHVLEDNDKKILAPTGAFQLAPITVNLADGDEPTRFAGMVAFRDVNMNLDVDLTDMGGNLLIGFGQTVEGGVAVRGAIVDGSGAVFRREFSKVALNLDFSPRFIRLTEIDGDFYKGSVRGAVQVHLKEPRAWELELVVADMDLAELLRKDLPRNKKFTGKVDAGIELRSPSGEISHMAGKGKVRITEGELMAIPGLRRVLSSLSRAANLGDRPKFKNAVIEYRIEGETIHLDKFNFSDKTSDLYSNGTVTIYRDLDLVVYPQVNKMIDLPRWLDVPVLSSLLNLFHKTVYEIRVGGTVESPQVRTQFLILKSDEGKRFVESSHAGRAERLAPHLVP